MLKKDSKTNPSAARIAATLKKRTAGAEAVVVAEEEEEEEAGTVATAKCLMLFAQAVAIKRRCRSSLIRQNLFTAAIASRSQEPTKQPPQAP